MINFLKKNPIFILAGATIIFAIIVLILGQILPSGAEPTPKPVIIFSPSPTSASTITKPEPNTPYQIVSPNDEEILRRDALINQLIKKLPFQGTNFNLTFDYSTNVFTATINAEAGNEEFDSYLRSNQIENRSWLKNLVIK